MEQKNLKLKDKSNEHIQVFVRVRPQNNNETTNKSPTVVDTTIKEIIVNERPTDRITKTFSFDKVFGQDSKQIEVYRAVVAPLIEEVLAGYNCTVFAYGQTGTGKTYTMEGDRSGDPNVSWDNDPSSGIIPRTLSHLFDELRVIQAEYTVRVSFLELYNEELFDLLSPADDTSKLKLYEDVNKKGSVIVHGLEEVPVHNKNEVYKIMEKGSLKRQTASTLMNAKSSRSHTIFSITVHIKENSLEGEELLKTGKLNLVDLAGSENVGRSGAIDKRAREAGNINQSLLTLGRCIKSLVVRTPHVPYRESKLTRLLQDSLGGKTKTSIIATISPSGCSLEETLSTLDYAHRAKNITNRPEINQKLTKKFLLKEYTEEIDRLRRDLMATREGNGVCIAKENYQEMIDQLENLQTEMAEKIGNIRALTDELEKKEAILKDLGIDFDRRTKELSLTNKLLNKSRRRLHDTKVQLRETEQDRDENSHLVEKHLETETELGKQAHQLLAVAEESTADTYKLHEKLMRKLEVEEKNSRVANTFLSGFNGKMEKLVADHRNFAEQQLESYNMSQEACAAHLATGLQSLLEKQNIVSSLETSLARFTEVILTNIAGQENASNDWLVNFLAAQASNCQVSCESVDEFINNINALLLSLRNDITSAQKLLDEEKVSMPLKLASQRESIQKHYQFQMDGMAELQSSVAHLVDKNIIEIETSRNHASQLKQMQEELVANINMATQNWLVESSLLSNKLQSGLTQAIANEKDIADTVASSVNQKKESYTTFDSQIAEGFTSLSNRFDSFVTDSSDYLAGSLKKVELVTLDLKSEQTLRKDGFVTEMTRVEKDVQGRMNDLALMRQSQIQIIEENNDGVQIATAAHEKSLQTQKHALEKYSSQHQGTEINRADQLTEWSRVACDELQTRKQEVVEFVNKDLSRDIPTGVTPVRKEFRYTNVLAATSPHQRILERFRASRPCILNDSFSSSDTNTIDSTSEYDQTLSIEEELKSLSGSRTSGIKRSLSTSDIPALDSENVLNVSAISEMEYKHENKENSSSNLCVPPTKPKKNGNSGSVNNISKSRVDSGLKKPLMAQNRP